MKKRSNKKDLDIHSNSVSTTPLNERETKLDTRKGMTRVKETVNIAWLEHEQLLFDNSQRNCNGYIPKPGDSL